MRILSKILLLILAITSIIQCIPPDYKKKDYAGVDIDFNDPVVKTIFDIKDRQSQDSLYKYFKNENPTYRYLAAMSFGSFKEISLIDSFARLFKDDYPDVRIAAAYALGQSGDPKAEPLLLKAYITKDTFKESSRINAAILEALGKCGSPITLQQIATTSTYKNADTMHLLGQTLALYRFGIRNIISKDGTARMVQYATGDTFPEIVRNAAANYCMKVKGLEFDSLQTAHIYNTLTRDSSLNVKIALAKAIGKSTTKDILQRLIPIYDQSTDYRIRCNLLAGVSNRKLTETKELILKGLKSKNQHVAYTAANYCIENSDDAFAKEILNVAADTTRPWRARLHMLEAANKYLKKYDKSKDSLSTALINSYATTTNPYQKAATLHTLSQHLSNYKFIWENGFNDPNLAVKTATVECIGEIVKSPFFGKYFYANYRYYKNELRTYLYQAIRSGDVGCIATAAIALRDPDSEFNIYAMQDSLPLLQTALEQLKIPRDIETYNELAHTIHYIKGETGKYIPIKPTFNHTIDWSILYNYTGTLTASVTTTKGNFDIKLIPEIAPGSVINFIKLARSDFFNNKPFHRIVANFVVQTGCNRGDGFGALDYSIRSDLANYHYDDEGWVGMASAGINTEGTQWFVTHSPTWHLDPNYTIIGKVIRGMQSIQELEQGDMVLKVSIK
jgi:cyclophilin family peptidyl-prolyl cis-trans isomerase